MTAMKTDKENACRWRGINEIEIRNNNGREINEPTVKIN